MITASRPGPGAAVSQSRTVALCYNTASYLLRFRTELIQAIQARDFQVIAYVPMKGQKWRALSALGVICRDLPVRDQAVSPWSDVTLTAYLLSEFRRTRPDVVMSFTVKPVVYASIAARLAGVPRILSMITGLGYAFTGETPRHRIIRAVLRAQYSVALRCNSAVFFQNPDDREAFVKRRMLRPDRALLVNGSGVNLAQYRKREVPLVAPVTFLLIGRMLWDKGIGEYASAALALRKKFGDRVRCLLVGPLDANPAAIPEPWISQLQADGAVEYLGEVDDVRPLLERASVFVLPSYREGLPRTVLEAMAVGLPIITTDAPGCRETVEPGVNGFVVPVRDAESLLIAMAEFVAKPQLIQAMGDRSRRLVEEKFNVHTVNDRILACMFSGPSQESSR